MFYSSLIKKIRVYCFYMTEIKTIQYIMYLLSCFSLVGWFLQMILTVSFSIYQLLFQHFITVWQTKQLFKYKYMFFLVFVQSCFSSWEELISSWEPKQFEMSAADSWGYSLISLLWSPLWWLMIYYSLQHGEPIIFMVIMTASFEPELL